MSEEQQKNTLNELLEKQAQQALRGDDLNDESATDIFTTNEKLFQLQNPHLFSQDHRLDSLGSLE